MLLSSLVLSLALSHTATTGDATVSPTGVLGDWERPTKAVLRFHPCGNDVCATIVRLSPSNPRKTDSRNPDASLRARPLCGLEVGTGFHQVDTNHLTGGHLYDPVSGKTYSGMATSNGDEVKLRGYIGFSWLGKTEIWHRASLVSAADCK